MSKFKLSFKLHFVKKRVYFDVQAPQWFFLLNIFSYSYFLFLHTSKFLSQQPSANLTLIPFLFQERGSAYENTEAISLVSSFAASLFIGDVAAIELADAGGKNLFVLDVPRQKMTGALACLQNFLPNQKVDTLYTESDVHKSVRL